LSLAPFHQIAEADLAQKIMYLARQVFPQIMCQTGLSLMAVTFTLTIGDINRFVYRINDLRDKNVGATPR